MFFDLFLWESHPASMHTSKTEGFSFSFQCLPLREPLKILCMKKKTSEVQVFHIKVEQFFFFFKENSAESQSQQLSLSYHPNPNITLNCYLKILCRSESEMTKTFTAVTAVLRCRLIFHYAATPHKYTQQCTSRHLDKMFCFRDLSCAFETNINLPIFKR